MKIISWNCNGIKHNWNTIRSLLQTHQPEFLCIQDYRQHNFDLPQTIDIGLPTDEEVPDGEKWYASWTRISARTSLSNGTGILYRWRWYAFNVFANDMTGYENWGQTLSKHYRLLSSGRVSVQAYVQFIIVNVMPPGGCHNPDSPRHIARREFDDALLHLIVDLRKIHPVIVVGDFKIASEDIDLHPSLRLPPPPTPLTKEELARLRIKNFVANPVDFDNIGGPRLFTPIYHEPYVGLRIDPNLRQQFLCYRLAGVYDALRLVTDRDDLYSCWSGHQNQRSRFSNRDLNRGWRSDYFLVDRSIKHLVTNCTILSNVLGSRHAPILLDLNIESIGVPEVPPEDNPDLPPDETYDLTDSAENPPTDAPPDQTSADQNTGGYTSTYGYNPYMP